MYNNYNQYPPPPPPQYFVYKPPKPQKSDKQKLAFSLAVVTIVLASCMLITALTLLPIGTQELRWMGDRSGQWWNHRGFRHAVELVVIGSVFLFSSLVLLPLGCVFLSSGMQKNSIAIIMLVTSILFGLVIPVFILSIVWLLAKEEPVKEQPFIPPHFFPMNDPHAPPQNITSPNSPLQQNQTSPSSTPAQTPHQKLLSELLASGEITEEVYKRLSGKE